MTVAAAVGIAACSSDADESAPDDDDVVAEFCAAAERSLQTVVELGDEETSPEFEAASEAMAVVEPPAAIAEKFRLVLSGEDGVQSGVILDREQFDAYRAAGDDIAAFLVDECGLDADLVNGAN